MYSLDVLNAAQRAVHLRELVSLSLMLLPLVFVMLFLLANPGAWSTNFAVFFSQDREVLRNDPGWLLSFLALAAAMLCAWIGVLGRRENWKHNRRWQRGLLGSLAATLATVLFASWAMTQALENEAEAAVSMAMFATICAMLYGVLCATISPRDRVDTWYPDEDKRGEEASPHSS